MKSYKDVNLSDYLRIAHTIYKDACANCAAFVSDFRDLMTIDRRVENEGLSFLTITLPKFCSDFERSLEQGFVGPSEFRNFRKSGAIPAFLQGMLAEIFDRETGRLLNHEKNSDNVTIISTIRQICLFFKKIKLPCSSERNSAAISEYVTVEQELESFHLPDEERDYFSRVSSVLWDSHMVRIDPFDTSHKHGPGVTSEGISGNSKYLLSRWHERIEALYPIIGNGFPATMASDFDPDRDLKYVSFLKLDEEAPCKVILVPKTLSSPRVIAAEPCCNQYIQQGLLRLILQMIKSNPLTSGKINFNDQSKNQALALSSSFDGQYATIDLSEASDRVPLSLVKIMFQANPDLWECIEACRSSYAKLPDGRIIGPLNKFASMGSALCFPIEAMYFYTICVGSLLKSHNLPPTVKNVKAVYDVLVFGDDIIVSSKFADAVLIDLQKYNCKINRRKTFVNGKFRESCGVDAYDGKQVTPVYLRNVKPENRRQAPEIVSWTATGNLLFKANLQHTAYLLHYYVEKILRYLPSVPETSPALGRHYLWAPTILPRNRIKYDRRFQRRSYLLWLPRTTYRTDKLDGYAALAKSLISLGERASPFPSDDKMTFERTAVRGGLAISLRWVSATE